MPCEVRFERITPQLADKYLSYNVENNRSINKDRVDSYAHDMMSGNWSLNGESIKFDKEGRLIDGQHRLRAILKSGITVTMLVVHGVDNDAFKTVDGNMPRTVRQRFMMNGYSGFAVRNSSMGAIKQIIARHTGVKNPTYSMCEEFYNNNEDILEWAFAQAKGIHNVPSPYLVAIIEAHVCGESDDEIHGFLYGALKSEFDAEKDTSSYKLCVDAERYRKSRNGWGYSGSLSDNIKRFLYSYAKNYKKLSNKTDVYPCAMKSNYRLIDARKNTGFID